MLTVMFMSLNAMDFGLMLHFTRQTKLHRGVVVKTERRRSLLEFQINVEHSSTWSKRKYANMQRYKPLMK